MADSADIRASLDRLARLDSAARRRAASLLNPDAGDHTIPSDLREVDAALRAGERSWAAFPYFERRYGERGRRFTRSDSAWLVTLCDHDQPHVDEQIRWLGRLLSSRGMPRWLLECHLSTLHDELAAAVPERRAAYATLGAAGQVLADERRRQIGDEAFEALSRAFDAAVGQAWAQRLRATGSILVAAVADERAGIAAAVTSLEGWMTDPERFPAAWIQAVQTTIAQARQQG